MKRRKGLVSEEELDKIRKASTTKRASETGEQTLHRQEQNQTHDKHKHLSSSLRRGFCTSVLFIITVQPIPYLAGCKQLSELT